MFRTPIFVIALIAIIVVSIIIRRSKISNNFYNICFGFIYFIFNIDQARRLANQNANIAYSKNQVDTNNSNYPNTSYPPSNTNYPPSNSNYPTQPIYPSATNTVIKY